MFIRVIRGSVLFRTKPKILSCIGERLRRNSKWTSGNGYIHADLVLIDLAGKLPEEALTIGRRLREHCKYDGHTPLIIMPEKIPQHLQGTDKKVNDLDWICYYEDVDQLKRLLARLLSKNGKPSNP